MRILVYGFIESRGVSDAARTALQNHEDVQIVGWVGRRRFASAWRDWEIFEEPLPRDAQVELGWDALLGTATALEDENFRYLLDREVHFEDQYEVTQLRSSIACYAQQIVARARPDAIVFSDVPHTALSYALYLLAQREGIGTRYFRAGPAPHLFTFAERIGPALVDFVRTAAAMAAPPTPASREYLATLGGGYEQAAPAYMRRQGSGEGMITAAVAKLRARPGMLLDRDSPAKLRTHLRRNRLRDAYERRAIDAERLNRDSVVMYLHLQPERSTTPEGGFFAQQWLMAYAIASHLPAGWELGIREHPSTFLTGPRLVRTPAFYDALLAIPHTHLVSTRSDPFDLLDRSRAVATVTGSIGFEAIARGTPALVFGDAVYRGCPGSYHIQAPEEAGTALQAIEAGPSWNERDVLEFLADFERSRRVVVDSRYGNDLEAAVWTGEVHGAVLTRMLDDLRKPA